MFSVRVVTADYYMSSPLPGLDPCHSHFREAPVKKVPVVRIFGATPAGQKTCLHLHGIFPYLYVPYDVYGEVPEHYLRHLAFSIDRALNVALGNPSSLVQHVFKVSLVYGIPFYGYHEKERQFMKIYLYNPAMVKRVCELLQGGAIMNKIYQPHEAHIPYLLQLFIDYNLHGMNLINLAAVKFRKAKRKGDTFEEMGSHKDNSSGHFATRNLQWENNQIPSSSILDGVEPQSTCELEVDAVAPDILNRLDIEAQIGRNPGLQAIWDDEKQRRRENKESSQISPPNSQDRGFVTATESEKIFQKRLKEILKQCDLSVTLSGSLDSSNGSQEFSAELTLHSESESPSVIPCSPANMVEVHRDKMLNKEESHRKYKEEHALINEEAILNIMENSQHFQPISQRLNKTPVFMGSSANQAMIHLLNELEDDEYETGEQNTLSQHFSSGSRRNPQNSDDEENEPQIEKEEMELSLLMSQQWDSSPNEDRAKRRSASRSRNHSSAESDDSSEEDMDWNDNDLLLANLSIPQLDGTADENSDNPLNNENSRSHTSVIATSKMSVKASVFHNAATTLEPPSAKITFQCKHKSALSSHMLSNDDLEGHSQPDKTDVRPELSVHSLTKESTYSVKYPTSFNNIIQSENYSESNKSEIPVSCETVYGDISISRHLPNRKYTGIRKATKDMSLHLNRQMGENILVKNCTSSDLGHSKNKASSETNKKASNTNMNSLYPGPENCELVSFSENNRTVIHSAEGSSDRDGLNNLKIKYEDFQEHKTEKTNANQQAAHYMFFPSVVLSNCLNQPQKLGPVTYKLQQSKKQSRLKRNKKKVVLSNQQTTCATDIVATKQSCCVQGPVDVPARVSLLNDMVQVPHGTLDDKTSTDTSNPVDFHFEGGAQESEQGFGLCGNKYTLRAKRKINYETEDSESSIGMHNSKISLPHSAENDEIMDGLKKCRKRRKLSKRLPPVIIKYIIINRFRGRKNMLVKLGKIDSSEKQVILTEEKMNLYKKLAPLKDFWPKVPDSPATKYPIYPLTPKKSNKRKTKCKSTKKKVGKLQNVNNKNIKRALYFRKRARAFLSPPLPSYSAEAGDCDSNYSDVMSKLGFLTERSPSPVNVTPPRCWSPTDPNAEEITNLEKEVLVFKNASTFSNKTVNSCIGKRSKSKTQAKKCKRQFSNSTVRTNKKSKNNLSKKTGKEVKKKPRARQKQKTEKVSKLMAVIDEKNSIPPTAEINLVLKQFDLPENTLNVSNSQPPYTQKDTSATGSSVGCLPSSQLPVTAHAQVNPLIYFHSLLENEKPLGYQDSSLAREDLHPAIASVMSGRDKAKINFQRSNSQNAVFRTKEPALFQNSVFEQSHHLSQVALNAYCSNDIMPKKAEEITNSQCRILSSPGKINENCVSSDPMKIDQIHPNNFLLYKDNQQQIAYLPESTKHADHVSSFFKTSEESHGSFQLPKKCFMASLRSPVKKLGWEQKQRGFIFDMSHFNNEKSVKQKDLTETISHTKADSQCKGKMLLTPSVFSDGHSSLAVLKELLQKRQQKTLVNNMHEQLSVKIPLNRSASYPLDQNKSVKKSSSVISQRKPRTSRYKKSEEKALKLLIDSAKHQNIKTGHAASIDSPVFYSDPGFESCYSLEDSLSPDHNFNFDINTIGQAGFCSLYSASQFVPADQNLPQKFLSDVAQDLFPSQIAETDILNPTSKISKEDHHYTSDSTTWLRSGPLSPQLFDRRCMDSSENHLHSQWKTTILPSASQPSSPVDAQQVDMCQNEQFHLERNAAKKGIFLNLSSPNSDWSQNHFRKEATFEPNQSLDSVSISFSSILSSPDGELIDAASEDLELYLSRNNEGLTPTPDSSPRSTNSPSQSKNGSCTPRAAHILKPLMSPPSREEIMSTLFDHNLAETIYQEPFCSNPSDAPEKPREIGGRLLTVETRLPNDLLEFEGDFSLEGLRLWKTAFLAMAQSPRPGSPLRSSQFTTEKKQRNGHKTSEDKKIVIMPCKCAPSCQQVQSWLQAKEEYDHLRKRTVTKSAEVEKVDESLTCKPFPKNLCYEVAKAAENSSLQSKHVQSEDFCSSSRSTPSQTVEDSDSDVTELNRAAVKKRTVPFATAPAELNRVERDYINYSSADSSAFPPWQQVASPNSKQFSTEDSEDMSSVEENETPVGIKKKLVKEEARIPLSVSSPVNKGCDISSESVCLHSTPIREEMSQNGISEALALTPLLPEPNVQKLISRKGSNIDALRKVLLTTQLKKQCTTLNAQRKDTSQIEGPSLNNSYGFKISVQNLQDAKALHEVQHLTLLSVELHARTRRDLEADPEFDPICALFYCISSDTPLPNTDKMEIIGAVVIDKDRTRTISSQGNREHAPLLTRSGISGLEVTYATDERALFQEVVNIVKRNF